MAKVRNFQSLLLCNLRSAPTPFACEQAPTSSWCVQLYVGAGLPANHVLIEPQVSSETPIRLRAGSYKFVVRAALCRSRLVGEPRSHPTSRPR